MKAFNTLALTAALCCTAARAAGNPSTFWSDYPSCENTAHQSVWAAQSCSLQNACSCNGCLCLEDSCLCNTVSWLTAVAKEIGKQCGSSAVSDAYGISSGACSGAGYPMVLNETAWMAAGDAAAATTTGSSIVLLSGELWLSNTLHAASTATPTPTASSTTASAEPSSSSSDLGAGATIGLTIGCTFGAALLTILATWYRPKQIGKVITLGRWPKPTVSQEEAREDMARLLPGRTRRQRGTRIVV